MFDLTKKADYGLQLMSFLAQKYGQGPVSLKIIAKDKKLPLKFLEQIVMPLRQAGLIKAKEGRAGGYILSFPPKIISVAQVIEALEGPVSVGACFGCPQAQICGQKNVWQEVGNKVRQTIKDKTLADLK
jgi:Rrf2 family cysteine metabolism transcriptional repressor